MKSGSYIVIVIIASLVLIGFLFWQTPDTAPNQLPLILAAVGALVAVLNKQGDTDSKVETSVIASEHNAAKLEKVDQKLTVNSRVTDATHVAVNSRMDELIETVKKLAETQQQLAGARGMAAGIAEGRAQVIQEIVPPAATPSHGTPIVEPPSGESRVGDQH